MGRFGKKVTVSKGMENYMIGVMAPSGFGKTTLLYKVCDKKFGEDGYILLDVGDENGVAAIDGVVAERVPTWKSFKEVIDDIVKNKETDYPNLKVVVLDTLDSTFEIAESYVVTTYNKEHLGEQNFKPATSINAVEGGFGRGLDRVIETVKKEINRLNKVGVGVWWTSHVKERDQTDLFTGSNYTQLTASMSMKYFNSIKDISHLIGFGYYDRSIQKIEVGDANPVTKKKKTRESVTSEYRKIKFRDDSLVADAKSRFSEIVDEINLSTDEFIKAVEDAIKAAANGTSESKPVVKAAPAPAPVEEDSEMSAQIDEEDDMDSVPFNLDEDEDDSFDEEAVKEEINKLFKAADAATKKGVRSILNGNKLADIHDETTLNRILEALA
jgi:GTPase SAR1 family protein